MLIIGPTRHSGLKSLSLVVISLVLGLPRLALSDGLSEMLHAVQSADAKSPTEKDLAEAEKLFRRLFMGERGPALRQQWADLGFELTGTRAEKDPLLVLQEFGDGATQSDFSGKGFFVFAVGRHSKTVLQAPHSFRDEDTQDIALKLMAQHNFRAAAWNTGPAKLPVHATVLPGTSAPPAKDYLLAFTRALMTIEPDSRVVQLHSFDQKKMYSATAKHADIILSGFGDQPNQAIGWMSRCLKKNLSYKIRVFPYEVQEMGAGRNLSGASDNAIGALMQAAESQGFVHLAMSEIFREDLRSFPQVQEKLFACLSRE